MKDSFGRSIEYLRLSVTERCNHACFYCRSEGQCTHKDEISLGEISTFLPALARAGVKKVRLTGGEPLIRRDILDICRLIRGVEGIEELCLTTNGSLLSLLATELRDAGVSRVNISINTLKDEKFRTISSTGSLRETIKGIESAKKAGFDELKLNTVLIKGVNDDEIEDFVKLTEQEDLTVRFIEFMPLGIAAGQFEKRYMPSSAVLERCPELEKVSDDGVSVLYKLPGAVGSVGLIRPVSDKFCSSCNRLRLTSTCMLRPCLHSDRSISLKSLNGKELDDAIALAVSQKPFSHHLDEKKYADDFMNTIGG